MSLDKKIFFSILFVIISIAVIFCIKMLNAKKGSLSIPGIFSVTFENKMMGLHGLLYSKKQ